VKKTCVTQCLNIRAYLPECAVFPQSVCNTLLRIGDRLETYGETVRGDDTQLAREKPAAITPVSWVTHRELSLAEWATAGRNLGAIGRCNQWWLGDWIRYGNTRFGERYARAATITGYDPQSLMNMVRVASRFEISRRRENLFWSHHEAVASLDPDEQNHWLDLALTRKLTVADLRIELRGRGGSEAKPRASAREPDGALLICPNCGETITRQAELPHGRA
jgi:hypothetical protein